MANHSGISTDILLLSDIHLSLTHHYRVCKCGLPHITFRKEYLARLRGSVTWAAGQSRCDTISPVASSPVSLHYAHSVEQDSKTSRLTRRGRRRMRPVRIQEESVGDLQVVTAQEASHMQGVLVYDCRHLCYLFLCGSKILGHCLCVGRLLRPVWRRLPRRT